MIRINIKFHRKKGSRGFQKINTASDKKLFLATSGSLQALQKRYNIAGKSTSLSALKQQSNSFKRRLSGSTAVSAQGHFLQFFSEILPDQRHVRFCFAAAPIAVLALPTEYLQHALAISRAENNIIKFINPLNIKENEKQCA